MVNLGELPSRHNLCTRVCTIGSRIFPNSLRFVTLYESVPCFHGSRCFARTTLSSLQKINALITLQDPLLWLKLTILYLSLNQFTVICPSHSFFFLVCGLVQNDTLRSPNFPGLYPSNLFCVYRVNIPRGKGLNIHFNYFNLEYYSNCT